LRLPVEFPAPTWGKTPRPKMTANTALPRIPSALRGGGGAFGVDMWFKPLAARPPLIPEPPAVQAPHPPPQAADAYEVGKIYAGKDAEGGWQLVRITRGADSDGILAGDVLANVSSRPGVQPLVLEHWPTVYGMPRYLMNLPAPPLESQPPPAAAEDLGQKTVFVKGDIPGHWILAPAMADNFSADNSSTSIYNFSGDNSTAPPMQRPEFVLSPAANGTNLTWVYVGANVTFNVTSVGFNAMVPGPA